MRVGIVRGGGNWQDAMRRPCRAPAAPCDQDQPQRLFLMATKRVSLDVINGATATFECIYGRGCDGICCQNGRPPVSAEEAARIDAAPAQDTAPAHALPAAGGRHPGLRQPAAEVRQADAARDRWLVRVLQRGLRPAQARRQRRRQVPLQAGSLLPVPPGARRRFGRLLRPAAMVTRASSGANCSASIPNRPIVSPSRP